VVIRNTATTFSQIVVTDGQSRCTIPDLIRPAFPTPFATGAQLPLPNLPNGTYDGINAAITQIIGNARQVQFCIENPVLRCKLPSRHINAPRLDALINR